MVLERGTLRLVADPLRRRANAPLRSVAGNRWHAVSGMGARGVVSAGLALAVCGGMAAGACTFDLDRFAFGGVGGGGPGGAGGGGGTGGQPVQSELVAEGQDRPYGIASDGAYVYWTNIGDGSSPTGSLMRAPVDGGSPEALATGLIAPTEIVLDGTTVYWVTIGNNQPTGGVHSLPKAGGAQPTDWVVQYQGVYDLVVVPTPSPARVYYTCVECDGAPLGRVEYVTAPGGTRTVVASNQGVPASITAAGSTVFWVNREANQVMVSTGAGGGTQLTDQADVPDGIAAAEGLLYWTSSNDSKVQRMPETGGAVLDVASGEHYTIGIAVDNEHVYWPAGPSVMRAQTPSGEAVAYVSGQTLPLMVALDAERLYWTDYSAGRVMKAPK